MFALFDLPHVKYMKLRKAKASEPRRKTDKGNRNTFLTNESLRLQQHPMNNGYMISISYDDDAGEGPEGIHTCSARSLLSHSSFNLISMCSCLRKMQFLSLLGQVCPQIWVQLETYWRENGMYCETWGKKRESERSGSIYTSGDPANQANARADTCSSGLTSQVLSRLISLPCPLLFFELKASKPTSETMNSKLTFRFFGQCFIEKPTAQESQKISPFLPLVRAFEDSLKTRMYS